jgi:predicted PurR-regulated permease PerM
MLSHEGTSLQRPEGWKRYAPSGMEDRDRSLRDHLERLMPPGGRARMLVGWGVVAWATIGGLLLLWAGARIVSRVAGVFPYLVVAGIVVFVLNPLVRRVAGLGVPRRLAATMVFAAALALTVLALSLMVPILIRQFQHLTGSSPELLRQGGLFERLARSTNPALHQVGEASLNWLRQHAGSAPRALETAASAGLKLAHAGVVLLVGGLLGFLLLLSLPETTRGMVALVPPSGRDRAGPPLAEVRRIVSGYVRARLIVSGAVGLLATVGMWAVHMPFWLILGVIVGVANLIPMLGSWIGGIPVAFVSLLTKPPSFLLVVLAVVVFAHLVDGFVLSPIVLKETTDLHPVVILLAVLLGADLLGFWGILAAIPVAGVANFGVREWVLPRVTGTRPRGPVPVVDPAVGVQG